MDEWTIWSIWTEKSRIYKRSSNCSNQINSPVIYSRCYLIFHNDRCWTMWLLYFNSYTEDFGFISTLDRWRHFESCWTSCFFSSQSCAVKLQNHFLFHLPGLCTSVRNVWMFIFGWTWTLIPDRCLASDDRKQLCLFSLKTNIFNSEYNSVDSNNYYISPSTVHMIHMCMCALWNRLFHQEKQRTIKPWERTIKRMEEQKRHLTFGEA